MFAHHYNIRVQLEKTNFFKAIKVRTVKIAKFYSSENKWVYSN